MIKITKSQQKTVTTDIYVSVDGKEFTNPEDCMAWEQSYRGTLEASVQEIKRMPVCGCYIYLPGAQEDDEVYVMRPKNIDEIILINAYINSLTPNINCDVLTAQMIGKEIAINFGFDHDICQVYVLEDLVKNIYQSIHRVVSEFNQYEKEGDGNGI